MARFYGWSHDYIMSLPVDVALDYWHAISPLDAEEKLASLNASMMPYAKEDNRDKYYKNLEKIANQVRKSNSVEKKISNEELFKILKNR